MSRISLPLDVPTPVYFIDESGSKGSGGDFFVVAALKTREPDLLTRGMEVIRDRSSERDELKFRKLTKRTVPIFKEMIELINYSDTTVGAFIIDKSRFDPFDGQEQWQAHVWAVAALVKGMTTRKELATLLIDGISTPAHVAYGLEIRAKINKSLRSTRVVSAVSLDSRSSDGLQLADLVASAIAHQRTWQRKEDMDYYNELKSPKAIVAKYLARTLDLPDFRDTKTDRVSVRTAQPARQRQKPLDSDT